MMGDVDVGKKMIRPSLMGYLQFFQGEPLWDINKMITFNKNGGFFKLNSRIPFDWNSFFECVLISNKAQKRITISTGISSDFLDALRNLKFG